ncbi:MAG: nucleic acid-binding protein [Alkalinema sp. CACIAM 70d]|nr:MAG: nucleic acid-binding protein [Alkalinema sp. CACIAM 70d]
MPLFYLHQIDRLDLLQNLYSTITVPTAVQRELGAGEAQGFRVPPCNDLSWMVITSAKAQFLPNITDLGDGEAEVIALGLENPGSLLILDDALGRRIARLYRLTYTGTLGVLVRAKQLGYLDRVEPVMQALQNHGLWISATVMENILQLAGETS